MTEPPTAVEPIHCRGALGLWNTADDVDVWTRT